MPIVSLPYSHIYKKTLKKVVDYIVCETYNFPGYIRNVHVPPGMYLPSIYTYNMVCLCTI